MWLWPQPALCVCVCVCVCVWQLCFNVFQGWTKGVVFINGQNLGRYWNLGPQETLYLPGPWLKPGLNEVTSRSAPLPAPGCAHPTPPSMCLRGTPASLQIIVFEEVKSALLIYFSNVSQLGKGLPPRLPRLGAGCPGPVTLYLPHHPPASLSEVLTATSAVSPAAVAPGPFLAVTGWGTHGPASTAGAAPARTPVQSRGLHLLPGGRGQGRPRPSLPGY